MTHFYTEESQEWVTEGLHRIARGVEEQESLPDDPAAPSSEDTKDEIESDTSTVANTGEYESVKIVSYADLSLQYQTYGAPDQPRISVVMRKNI
jgi:hypothetical protein